RRHRALRRLPRCAAPARHVPRVHDSRAYGGRTRGAGGARRRDSDGRRPLHLAGARRDRAERLPLRHSPRGRVRGARRALPEYPRSHCRRARAGGCDAPHARLPVVPALRRGRMSRAELYLDPRGSFFVRRPASACVVVILFIAVVNFGVLPRLTAAWEALGLSCARASYLAMPVSVLGRALGVVCALAAAAGSEILYRGYLRVVAERVFRAWWTAAIVVSAVFGWAHGFYGWCGALYTGLNGLAFALLAHATGSLYVVILAHMCFDALVFAAG